MVRDKLVKVQFYDPDIGYENLWAARISNDTYRIESVPFFIYGIALGDIVIALPNDQGRLSYIRTAAHSRNRTLRARSDQLINNADARRRVIAGLKALGCAIELHRSRLISINVPANAEIEPIKDYLAKNELSWEYGCPENLNR